MRVMEDGGRVNLEYMNSWKVGEGVVKVIAITMLEKSIDLVQNSDAYMQFDTCSKLR